MSTMLPSGIGISVVSLADVVAPPAGAAALIISSDTLAAANIEELARYLIASDYVFVAIVGNSAEQMHDRLDDALLATTTDVSEIPVTTWHEDEANADVLRLAEQMLVSRSATDGEIRIVSRLPTAEVSSVAEVLRVLDRERAGLT